MEKVLWLGLVMILITIMSSLDTRLSTSKSKLGHMKRWYKNLVAFYQNSVICAESLG